MVKIGVRNARAIGVAATRIGVEELRFALTGSRPPTIGPSTVHVNFLVVGAVVRYIQRAETRGIETLEEIGVVLGLVVPHLLRIQLPRFLS